MRRSCVVTAPFDGELTLEHEDVDFLRTLLAVFRLAELVAAQRDGEQSEIWTPRILATFANLGCRKHGVAGEQRCDVTAGRVDHVGRRVVADVRTGQAEAQVER